MAVPEYIQTHLNTWASIGVHGHFRLLEDSPVSRWQLLAEEVSKLQAPIVGASPDEVATMGTLTSNLHLLMASFYCPVPGKSKIIMDWKSFPSDHFAIESQIRMHGFDPKENMIMVGPEEGEYEVSTESILKVIEEHASTTALVLLPGIQYYTGQFFDMKTITAFAQSKGLLIGWDCAHAAGNVPLHLHDWNADFASWCTYKYMNAGPGSISGIYVHERHGKVSYDENDTPIFRPRLSGWYGGDQTGRMNMDNNFRPSPGASGFQVSNPSVIDLASLAGALSVHNGTNMAQLREKSVKITAYLEHLLLSTRSKKFRIITPSDPEARGTQLSILMVPGIIDTLRDMLEEAGIVFDKRRPDVIRIAPVPLYNTYEDVWRFAETFKACLAKFE